MIVDTLIVGQGLAGSLLAWELIQRGQHVVVIDDENPVSASNIAAGIINPITGQRLVKSWQVDVLLPAALHCYRVLEQALGQRFYQQRAMVWLFRTEKQWLTWQQRQDDTAYQAYLGNKFLPGMFDDKLLDPLGGIEQPQTGFLMMRELLLALKQLFISRHSFHAASIDYDTISNDDGVVKWGNFQAKNIIFCEGFKAQANPWFANLPFQLSKGEIITFTSDLGLPKNIINDGYWLVPLNDQVYRAGATYSADALNSDGTEEARKVLLSSIQRKLKHTVSLKVISHHAGIRPTTSDKKPFIGTHPQYSQMAIFNGFGSKGALMIPYFASQLCDYLLQGTPLPTEVDIKRFARVAD